MEDAEGALSAQLSKYHLEYGRRAARPSVFSVKKPGARDQTQWISRPAKEHRWSYLSLPGEIRNRIVKFILCPGDIYLPPMKDGGAKRADWTLLNTMELHPPLSATKAVTTNHLLPRQLPPARIDIARWTASDTHWLIRCQFQLPKAVEISQVSKDTERCWYNGKPKPSWQLLATCKQVYDEGSSLLYGLNVFHLATGDLSNSRVPLRRVREPSCMLLRKVCLDISLADLDQDVKDYTNMDYEIRRFGRPSINTLGRHTLARHALYVLRNLWASKLAYIRGIQSLDQLIINFNLPLAPRHRKLSSLQGCLCDTWIIKGTEISKALRAVEPMEEFCPLNAHGRIRHGRGSFCKGWDPEMKRWFVGALRTAEKLLRDNVPQDGLRTFHPWLEGMAGGPYDGADVVVQERGANNGFPHF